LPALTGGEGNIRESFREDIPKDVIPSAERRDPRVKCVMISRSLKLENEATKLADDAVVCGKKK
jgi:hypothetical protein